MTPDSYKPQARGSDDAYARYYAGMDVSMRQKLAFVSAHFLLDPGSRIADLGCGSGLGSYQLALLNPQIQVIGVDVSEDAIAYARTHYQLPNLSYVIGDASTSLFADDPLDGILTSSTLHHVFTFTGYSQEAVRSALASHIADLKENGILVVRDFVAPPDPDRIVILELPQAAGDASQSGADLLLQFARTARPLDELAGPGFFAEELRPKDGWRRFRLAHRWAAEFLLRKDYRRDWETELLEQYTYFTADEFVRELDHLGARVLHAAPYWNPWIVENRFIGKARLRDEDGTALAWPATNFVVVAQRCAPGDSLRLAEKRPSETTPTYLQRATYRDRETGKNVDLVRRPHPTLDLVPYVRDGGRVRLLARHGYPRPIMNAAARGGAVLDTTARSGHTIEPIAAVAAKAEADIAGMLEKRAGIDRALIRAVEPGLTYYPSPGGIDEIVRSRFVVLDRIPPEARIPAAVSGFSGSGSVRSFDAQELLRAAQVGMLPEARLELNAYALLERLGIARDPWIGTPVRAGQCASLLRGSLDAELGVRRTPFEPCEGSAGYLRHLRSLFVDQTSDRGRPRTLASQELEFVVPAELSAATALLVPVARDADGTVCVGLEPRNLVPPQLHEENARLLVAPAFRLPVAPASLDMLRTKMAVPFGAPVEAVQPLGTPYFPSLGVTPERVFPFALDAAFAKQLDGLIFLPLDELLCAQDRLRDGHLLIALFRLAHALGLG